MTLSLGTIFKKSPVSVSEQNVATQGGHSEDLQQGETYEHWGKRVCAITNGSVYALTPYLQRVYNYIYQDQINNQVLQEEQRERIRVQVVQKQSDLDGYKMQLDRNQTQRDDCRRRMTEIQDEIVRIKNQGSQVNKDAELKFIIGLVILFPLTFYLFLFYSSTFYSAFFRDPTTMTSVFEAMFDPQTFEHAWNKGSMALFFVLCAPTIFLGLGFSLHFFSIQTSVMKYLKMAGLLCVTFSFDAILAYKIGEQFYNIGIIIGANPLGSRYGVEMAMADINTWTVIFCGFIAYIIWGIVFDMVMSAHSVLNLNTVYLRQLQNNLQIESDRINTYDQNEVDLDNRISETRGDINTLNVQLENRVLVDLSAIRLEMTNFYTGWITQMNVFGLNADQQAEAGNVFNSSLNLLNLNTQKNEN